MEDLLIHTSNVRVDVLEPNKLPGFDRPCICFSLNQFISFFGEYIYLFKKDILEKNFFIEKVPTEGVGLYDEVNVNRITIEYRYRSDKLGNEFRIYDPIDVQRYGLGVVTNFNHLKGVLEKRMGDRIIREMVDFSKQGEKYEI